MTGGQAQTPGRGAGPYNGWDAFEAFVHRIMDEEQIPGVSVAFARHGELVYARGFGFRDREAGIPADAATVYGVASVTKSFTAMAIMKLQDEGKLSVHDPVRRYLPGFSLHDPEGVAGGGADVTIHHLLSHTSGLPPLGARRGVLPGGVPADPPLPAPPTLEALLRYLAEQPYRLLGAPGEHLSYCNDGYALLGAVVERVSGRPFTEFVRQEILEPAGMTRSTFDEAVLRSFPAVTQLYERTPDGAVAASPGWPEWGLYASSGALRSTVLDLLRYLEIYRNGGRVSGVNILSPAALAAMTTPVYDYLPGVHYCHLYTSPSPRDRG